MSEETRATRGAKNRKDWVKNAAIIFLSVMLVLTLFSNTFMNYSLPEVSTQYVAPGTITSKVRGTGTISAADPYSVVLNETRVVASVLVRSGDTVEKDQVILMLEETESEELKNAQKQLEQMISSYESGIIASGIPAEDVYAAQNGTGGSFAENLARLAELEAAIETTEKQLQEYDKQIISLEDQLAATGVSGVSESESYLQGKLNETQAVLDTDIKELFAAAEKAMNEAQTEEEKAAAEEAKRYAEGEKARKEGLKAMWQAQLQYIQLSSQLKTVGAGKDAAQERLLKLTEESTDLRASSGNIQSLTAQLQAIEEQRALVEELKAKETAAEVKSPVSGTVTSISYRAGETIEAGATVAAIQISGKECTMTMSVTAEQAASLRVGDVADIQNAWYYSGVTAVLTAIRVDPSNPQTNKLLVFTVEGEVMDGQSLSISVGQKSAEYSLTVPNSAIREDNNGKFILIVEYKQSPLGTRYVATRVDVEVLASDETSSAISGLLNGYEYVITTASKPVAPGQLIRLTE
ncbi:MAG: HlyD family efflux transporter periplasmic adaptor subunit [Lachnospiraceae bacterium]|nr:HlyD family efflux transporter periplasmic adaptor subunit [Lachnospiraceae bacterium]